MGGLILARMRCLAMYQLGGIGGTGPALPGPAASPLHDALNAVAAAAHAAITGCRVGQALHGSGKRSFADGQPSGATVQRPGPIACAQGPKRQAVGHGRTALTSTLRKAGRWPL